MSDDVFAGHFNQWSGPRGQALWLRNLRQFDEGHTAEFEDLLSSIAVPTLILWGEQDGWLDPQISEEVQRRIPGSKRALIAQAGHFAMEDQPDEVARHLRDFLQEGKKRPPASASALVRGTAPRLTTCSPPTANWRSCGRRCI